MIPDAVIDEVRARVDIVAVIGRHVELKRSGRTWKGCCVFHGERTPSFHVYPEDKHFKCYGCGEYGDVFKFLQKLEGKDFPEVVRGLAAEVGVTVPEREEDSAEQRRRRQERVEILAACDAAARYFTARLASRHGEEARGYLASRGITDETSKRFRLGVASQSWNDLTARMRDKGIGEDALERAGLVARREGADRYDRFRGRLMFPIAGLDGEVIGFGGRVLPGAPDRLAKYINSPESAVYKKSRVLYGLDVAREHIRRTRSVVLVEGYFDVIGLQQTGIQNAVAVCGTALTPEHVQLLSRLDCRTVTFLFDGDAAGVSAGTKAAQVLQPSGLHGRIALLPTGAGKTDPDEFARSHGLTRTQELIQNAQSLVEYLIERARADHCGPNPKDSMFEQRLAAYRQLRPLIDATPAGIARSTFEDAVAKALDLDIQAIAMDTGTAQRVTARPGPRAEARTTVYRAVVGSKSVDALALLAAFPRLAEVALEERFVEHFEGLPLQAVARSLVEGAIEGDAVVPRVEGLLPEAALNRIRKLLAEARPEPDAAEREFRKAIVEAKIEALGEEIGRLSAEVARVGSPVPDDLRTAMLTVTRRRGDLEKRRDGRRPG